MSKCGRCKELEKRIEDYKTAIKMMHFEYGYTISTTELTLHTNLSNLGSRLGELTNDLELDTEFDISED